MAVDLRDTAQFSVQGSRFQRLNPDGTLATAARTVSATPTFDASALPSNTGNLIFKRDNESPVTISVNLSGAADPSAVTAEEAAAAISHADLTVSVESATGRVLIEWSGSGTPSYMQFYGPMAGVLGIGGTSRDSSLGTKFKKFFDSVTSLARAKNLKEGEEVEAEAGDGTLWIVKTSTIMKGENVVFNMVKDDDEFKELVMGGTWNPTTKKYTYPTTDQTTQPSFRMQSFVAKYPKGTNDRTGLEGYSQVDHYKCTGMEGDISNEAKAWATLAYNISAVEWFDTSGNKQPSVEKSDLTIEEFDALNVTEV